MKNARRIMFAVLAVSAIVALIPDELRAQKLREKIKGFFLEKMDDKALKQEVESTLHKFSHDGRERSYYLYVPSKWDKKTPIPVVFLFHGGGGARGALYYYELEPEAEKENFLLVAPNGTGESEQV